MRPRRTTRELRRRAEDTFAATAEALRQLAVLHIQLEHTRECYLQGIAPRRQPVPVNLRLSNRERQVLELVANGRSTKQIAGDLGISFKTAVTHRSHLMEKLGVHDTASLMRVAIRAGLVEA